MKVALRVLGIIAACIGIYFSINMINSSKEMEVPKKYVYVSKYSSAYDSDWSANTGAQYLGGDAYNYIVEASLKAGYYNATVTTKTIKEVGGTGLLFFSVFFLFFSLYSLQNCLSNDKEVQAKTEDDKVYQRSTLHLLKNIEELTKSGNTADNHEYRSLVLQHLQNIEESTTSKKNDPFKNSYGENDFAEDE